MQFFLSTLLPLLRGCAVALAIAVFMILQASAESFEIQIHETEVSGTRDLEAGNYQKALERLEKTLTSGSRMAHSKKIAVLSNLCLAYTMVGRYQAASDSCEQAIATGWSASLAYNNRGILNIAQGNYAAAIGDFRKGSTKGSGRRISAKNLALAEERLFAIQQSSKKPASTATIASETASGGV
jgi:tetratricopeptide (TPR) repeat protein